MAAGGVVQHGSHFDAGRMTALVLAAAAGPPVGFVSAHGLHAGSNLGRVQASSSNPGTGPIDVTITPDYTRVRDAKVFDGTPVPLGGLASGEHKQVPIPGTAEDEDGELGHLSSLKASVSGAATSSTHATFFGTVDGVFGELPLDVAIKLFVGTNVELRYPILGNDTTELFVGIDLTQMLSFPPEYGALESFAFDGGLNPALPGVFAAISPISIGATGFESASPFTGDAYVMAIGDAYLVTEPPLLQLLGLGLAGCWAILRRRSPVGGAHRSDALAGT